MIVGVSVFELHLPGARGLKEKRKVVKSLVERLHHRYRISIAETGHQNLHQRAEISLAVVGKSEGEIEHLLEELRRVVESEPAAMLTLWQPQILEGIR